MSKNPCEDMLYQALGVWGDMSIVSKYEDMMMHYLGEKSWEAYIEHVRTVTSGANAAYTATAYLLSQLQGYIEKTHPDLEVSAYINGSLDTWLMVNGECVYTVNELDEAIRINRETPKIIYPEKWYKFMQVLNTGEQEQWVASVIHVDSIEPSAQNILKAVADSDDLTIVDATYAETADNLGIKITRIEEISEYEYIVFGKMFPHSTYEMGMN